MSGNLTTPEAPRQIENYDLSGKDARARPPISSTNTAYRTPAELMREMGFDPASTMTPMQFLLAVLNNHLDRVYTNVKKKEKTEAAGGIGMGYRLEAAKTAAKYMHMEMPKVTIDDGREIGFGERLSERVHNGNERVRRRTTIIETVERESPDVPLPPANYPPVYNAKLVEDVRDAKTFAEDEGINPEGDKEYNPDNE